MPGHHTSKQKRQAKHVADSERRRGKDPKEAERIGWATVNARKSFQVHGPFASGKPGEHVYPTEKRAMTAARKLDAHIPKPGADGHEYHVKMYGTGTHTVKPTTASKGGEAYLPRPKTQWATPREGMSRMNYGVRSKKDTIARRRAGITPLGTHTLSAKGFRLVTLDDAYDALLKDQAGRDAYAAHAAKVRAPDPKRTAHVDRPPPAVSDVASRLQNERRVAKFPRKMKPTVQMKPISDAEAMEHLRSGTYNLSKQKSLRWLAALKALATGYGKTSGGGALKAANRGAAMPLLGPSGRLAGKPGGHYRKRGLSGRVNFGPDGRPGPRDDAARFGKKPSTRLRRAMEAMSSPVGAAKPPKVYLPGVHNPKSPVRHGFKKPSTAAASSSVGKGSAPLVVSSRSPRVAAGGGAAAELSNSLDNVVLKSEGAEMTRQSNSIDFDDLFKSELGADHLVDCPHCDAPITKSDLAKAHKGKGTVTHQSGPKHGKSSAHVRDHNPEGGTTRGGDGRGVHTSSRGVPGAKKTDPAVGVQNGKGSHARKGGADSSLEEGEDDVDKSTAVDPAAARPRPTGSTDPGDQPVKKSITIRGTSFVQYVDDGSDAALAKSILEGRLGGTPPTQPLDLNNDLTRLLV